MTQPGLRERKKEATRAQIAAAARRLFAERGFEAVRVAEVAAAAEVSEATVFNYFPAKEDLFFSGLEAFETELLDAIRERPAGDSALSAFGRFVTKPRGILAAGDDADRLAAVARVIEESPALLTHESQIFAGFTERLAALLAEETRTRPDALEPWVVANAMMGVHSSLVGFARRQVLDGVRNPRLGQRVRAQAKRSLAALDQGLGDYDVR